MVNAPRRFSQDESLPLQARPGDVRRRSTIYDTLTTAAIPGPGAPVDSTDLFGIRDLSLELQQHPSPRPETLSLNAAAMRQAFWNPRIRGPGTLGETTAVAQMLNTESRTRLMVARLHDLISQLCDLRVRAVGLTETSTSPASRALQASLSGLNSSLVLLDSAIKDLEDRVSGTARRLDRAAGRTISDWTPLNPWARDADAFGRSPARDLSSRDLEEVTDVAVPGTTREQARIRLPESLQARLGLFSQSLANLNSRLDRVASNFRNMQEFRIPGMSSTVSNSLEPPSSGVPAQDIYLEQSLWSTPFYHGETTLSSRNPLSARSYEMSAEEVELQNRAFQASINADNPITSREADSTVAWMNLGRRETGRPEREPEVQLSEAFQAYDRQSLRMQELDTESSTARLLDRHLQEEELHENEPPSRREPTAPSTPVPHRSDTAYCNYPAPKLSSHIPLSKDQERIFVDGIEYRNCLGLWLSYTGEHAPAHALPLRIIEGTDAMEE